jgi:SAM-dependent methyltransferase
VSPREGKEAAVDLSECASTGEGAWYDSIRYALVRRLLAGRLREDALVVDVGCGQGGILRSLRRDHPTMQLLGSDPFLTPHHVSALAAEGITATKDFPEECTASADVLLLMDVLEHVDDPGQLLRRALTLLRPGGVALLTVPAYRWLWSDHDVALGHRDRYTLPRLRQLLRQPDVTTRVLMGGYALPLLLLAAAPVRVVGRLGRRLRPHAEARSQLESVGGGLERLLGAIGRGEAKVFRARSPFGLTCVALVEVLETT